MLQQTQVATVIDYYQRFMKRFPTVKKLAAAEQEDVLKLWEGLGYYRRARQMHAAAQVVVEQHRGKFPEAFDEVLALPGIGRYTAGAILSISKDQRLPVLEGNTIRLFARLMSMKMDPRLSVNQKQLWAFSESILPKERCGDFNQALMELGSEICHPKRPKCLFCPVAKLCPTFQLGLQEQIPAASKKVKYENLHEAVVVIKRRGKFLVRRCGPGERWEGLWDFPRFEVQSNVNSQTPAMTMAARLEEQVKLATGLDVELKPTSVSIKHAVTKYRITLDCFLATRLSGRLGKRTTETRWMSQAEIDDAAMSITGRKIAKKLSDLEI